MIPSHLNEFPWSASHFFPVKNKTKDNKGRFITRTNWGLSDDGAHDLITASPDITECIATGQLTSNGKTTTTLVTVTITRNGTKWSDVASTSTDEFDREGDRRKYFLAQMSFSRALSGAVMMALGLTKADIAQVVKTLKLKAPWEKGMYRKDETEEPNEPDSTPEVVEEIGDVTGLGDKFGI